MLDLVESQPELAQINAGVQHKDYRQVGPPPLGDALQTMTFLTIFSAPKPFTNPHIDIIQRNAIRSWLSLGEDVGVLLVGDEAGMAAVAAEYGVTQLAGVAATHRAPRWSARSLPRRARRATARCWPMSTPISCCCPTSWQPPGMSARQADEFLVIGQRWDLDVTRAAGFLPGMGKAPGAGVQTGAASCTPRQAAITSSSRAASSPICPISPSGAPAGITG